MDGEVVSLPNDDQPVVRRFAKGLVTCYLVDTGDAFQYVMQRHLRAAGWTGDRLHSLAVDNLAAYTRGKTRMRDYGSFYVVLVDGNFEASLIAVAPFWDGVAQHMKTGPDVVVALPARDVLAFCRADSQQGVANLRQTVARVYPRGDHIITDHLYRRREKTWTPLEE